MVTKYIKKQHYFHNNKSHRTQIIKLSTLESSNNSNNINDLSDSSNSANQDTIKNNLHHLKQILRNKVKNERKIFSSKEIYELSLKLCDNLLRVLRGLFLDYQSDYYLRYLGLYWPINGEPNILQLCHYFDNICLPKVQGLNMNFIKYNIGDFVYNKSFSLIYEPINDDNIVFPGVVLFPGMAFSVLGHRLGFGKGYYDRYINNYNENYKRPIIIGVCFHQWLYEYIPYNNNDVLMDYVITDQQIIKII